MRKATALLCGTAWILTACGPPHPRETRCTPGRVEDCSCSDGNSGARQCAPDGAWGSCSCEYFPDAGTGCETDDCAVVELAAGSSTSCIRRSSGAVACWGDNRYGESGAAASAALSRPETVGGIDDATSLAAADHGCVRLATGRVTCWGNNGSGELGDGTRQSRHTPAEVVGLYDAKAIAVGRAHSCAILATDGVACWGNNTYGQLGDGTRESRTMPTVVTGGLADATALALGNDHSCALVADGTVWCWGSDDDGELARGTIGTYRSEAAPVDGVTDAIQIAAGGHHVCALVGTGEVLCWGDNASGQLGDGTRTTRATPVAVSYLTGAEWVTAGLGHTCVIRGDDTLCWGANAAGQLGNDSAEASNLPVVVTHMDPVASLAAGAVHTCALLESGPVVCWGQNTSGELGDGTLTARGYPGLVLFGG